MKFSVLFVIIFVLLLNSCQQHKGKSNEVIISEVLSKYPQLKDDGTDYYKFVKGVTITNPFAKIQLYEPTDKEDHQKILIISNLKDESYAIPLLDNQYKNYWAFPFDKPLNTKYPTNTTFEKELNKGLDVLSLNRGYDGLGVISETFKTILNSRQLFESDTVKLKATFLNYDDSLPVDNSDTCDIRNKLNYAAIVKSMRLSENNIFCAVFLEENTRRIYQIQLKGLKRNTKNYYKMKIYRHGCVIRQVLL